MVPLQLEDLLELFIMTREFLPGSGFLSHGNSGGTSTQKLELSVTGASDPSARVKNLIARKLRADNIFVSTHASVASVA